MVHLAVPANICRRSCARGAALRRHRWVWLLVVCGLLSLAAAAQEAEPASPATPASAPAAAADATPEPTASPAPSQPVSPGAAGPAVTAGAAPSLPPQATAAETGIEGLASYYARKFTGRRTASGEIFDPNALTMAHPSWPFGTAVRVTHVHSGRSVVVRVNDRGPHVRQRIADLSPAAAQALGMLREGISRVRLVVLPQAESPR